jgi:rhodanese-related sulfurtransferase
MEPDYCEIPRWQFLKRLLVSLDPVDFQETLMKEKDPVLLDVRTGKEVVEDKLEGAVHLDYLDYRFLDELEKLDRKKPYFVYCRTGRRSVRTCTLMRNMGFKSIFNLEGGLLAWKEVFKHSVTL